MIMLPFPRRLERYRIIYSLKILQNWVPNCSLQIIPESETSRQGRRIKVPAVNNKAPTRQRLEQVFQVSGPKLFNSLPVRIRILTTQNGIGLEDYLENIPVRPKIDGLTPGTQDTSGINSNSNSWVEEGAMDPRQEPHAPVGVETKF